MSLLLKYITKLRPLEKEQVKNTGQWVCIKQDWMQDQIKDIGFNVPMEASLFPKAKHFLLKNLLVLVFFHKMETVYGDGQQIDFFKN